MQITKAIPVAAPALIMLYGFSGSGKTKTALEFAEGLKGDKRIGFIDTENQRGSHYALEHDFDKIDLRAPFTADRFIEALQTFEKTGKHSVVIIDSISHEWEGQGGANEQALMVEQRTGKGGVHCWTKPKYYHKRMLSQLTQSPLHIIFCCRAKEPTEQTKKDGKTVIKKTEMQPIQEGTFMNEILLAFQLFNKGEVGGIKWSNNALREIYEPLSFSGQKLNRSHGARLIDWITKCGDIDLELRTLKQGCRVAASRGNEMLDYHFQNMPPSLKQKLKANTDAEFQAEMRSLANQADLLQKEQQQPENQNGEEFE